MAYQVFPAPSAGIPSGNTASRPSSPVVGTTYYNGTKAILEIYNGSAWVPASAPSGIPSISVSNVGTGVDYGAAQALVTFTPNSNGGAAIGYNVATSTGGYTATTTSTSVTLTAGNNGSYTFSGNSYNDFGVSASSPTTTVTLTTKPQAPTIGTASTISGTANISVSWTLGNDGGSNLTLLEVIPYLNGTTAQTATSVTTSATTATITGLTMGSSYTFKVKATNANGAIESSATNSVTVPVVVPIQYLVVAGGGGGGNGTDGTLARGGGGAGAGGFRTNAGTSGGNSSSEAALALLPSTNYTVTIGAGGAAGTSQGNNGIIGNNTVFSTITSVGGGRGAGNGYSGGNGGSGGGGGSRYLEIGPAGAGTANQGFGGGTGYNNAAGSGGGAGAAGVNSNGFNGGTGGTGIASTITGTSVTYAGGGGAGGVDSGGAGGAGGGGRAGGGNGTTSIAGGANTGGGGGGGSCGNYPNQSLKVASAGGSGVVILRYPDTYTITIGAGLTGSTATTGSDRVTTITAGSGNVSWA